MKFGQLLKQKRDERGITQFTLAAMSGVSQSAISAYENGTREPSWESVQRLALALGVECNYFADKTITLPEQHYDR